MFQLRVLGGFALQASSGTATPSLPQRRAEAALAVLAVCGDLGCTRERLIGLLWSDSDEVRSRHGLRDALSDVRRVLGPDAVRSAGDMLRLDPAVVASDVRTFAEALGGDRREDAVRAYHGPLLDGFHIDDAPEFERWLDGERARLARECVEALVALADTAEASGAWRDAAGWWARALEQDPLNSHFVLQHVRALAALGDRANAIKVADAHARRLRDELDLEPDREVLAKIERIRRGELLTPPERPALPASGQHGGRGPAAIAERLHEGLERAEHLADRVAELTTPGASVTAASRRWPRRLAWAALAVLVVVAGVVAVTRWPPWRVPAPYPRTAVAVLPFQDFSADAAHGYFASGLHDELLTQLAKVSALKVIGRTSVLGYQGSTKPLRQIGAELGVGSIVEGAVQVIGDRLRVTVQLVDPLTQTHLWAEDYDRTLADAFAVETDIAQRVVSELGARLTESEAAAIAAPPTRNPEAYRLYLQCKEMWRRPGEIPANVLIAQGLCQQALALDSTFASAHALMALVHELLFVNGAGSSPISTPAARREAEAALRLAPDLSQAHLAMAAVHFGENDFARSLDELRLALRGSPNDPDVWRWLGFAHRRLGDWDSAEAVYQRLVRLDPRNADVYSSLEGYSLDLTRHYSEAIAMFRVALGLQPDIAYARAMIGLDYMKWHGQLDTLRAIARDSSPEIPPDVGLTLALFQRQPDTILALVRTIRAEGGGSMLPSTLALSAAMAHWLKGDSATARASFDSVVAAADSEEGARPDDWSVHFTGGFALAALGRRTRALAEARWLEQSVPYRRDRARGRLVAADRAYILIWLGMNDAALAELERLLSEPSQLSVNELRISPIVDPIRHDPRFQALLVKYAHAGAP